MPETLAPTFLIAVPQLLDPNFRQSVVLLLQQTEDGALGVVVNRESALRLEDLCKDHEIRYAGPSVKRVRFGGPVQPQQGIVLYSTEVEDPEGRIVIRGLQVSASTETLSRLCAGVSSRFHCYAGYAGWAPGQLEREIAEGSWIIVPADAALILDAPPEEIWERALRANGIDPALLVAGGSDVS